MRANTGEVYQMAYRQKNTMITKKDERGAAGKIQNEEIGDKHTSMVQELRKIMQINSEHGVAAGIEAKRIAEKYGKEFLSCDDLVEIMGVGRNNVRQLMCSEDFPTKQIGNRKVVSVIGFTFWSIQTNNM